tara:strand:- start:928 stop:1245 length:318 start_codon:yes stop_codon:yes gene_type:complete
MTQIYPDEPMPKRMLRMMPMPGKSMVRHCRLMIDPTCNTVDPQQYLNVAGEMLIVLLLVSAIVTGISKPETYKDNPLIDRLGFNNVCISFETKPAGYFAQVLWPA